MGLEETAGRLRTALAGMTDEQRAATLKQMFGQDAIRAASILYEQGAEGIQDWIRKVDDSGYAAESAATKLDNLKGDVEAFTGALETALIGTGEGAQGPLRTMVQLATGVVNVYNRMPGPVQAAAGALAGFTAVAGGSVWAGSKIVQFAADSRRALSDLGITATKVKGLLGGFSASALADRIVAEHVDGTAARGGQALDEFDGGGLAGAVGAEQGDHLAGIDPEIDAAQHAERAVARLQARDLKHGHGRDPDRLRRRVYRPGSRPGCRRRSPGRNSAR